MAKLNNTLKNQVNKWAKQLGVSKDDISAFLAGLEQVNDPNILLRGALQHMGSTALTPPKKTSTRERHISAYQDYCVENRLVMFPSGTVVRKPVASTAQTMQLLDDAFMPEEIIIHKPTAATQQRIQEAHLSAFKDLLSKIFACKEIYYDNHRLAFGRVDPQGNPFEVVVLETPPNKDGVSYSLRPFPPDGSDGFYQLVEVLKGLDKSLSERKHHALVEMLVDRVQQLIQMYTAEDCIDGKLVDVAIAVAGCLGVSGRPQDYKSNTQLLLNDITKRASDIKSMSFESPAVDSRVCATSTNDAVRQSAPANPLAPVASFNMFSQQPATAAFAGLNQLLSATGPDLTTRDAQSRDRHAQAQEQAPEQLNKNQFTNLVP